MKFKDGQQVVCINSASSAYKKHQKYTPYKNVKGIICLMGDDGFEDICSMLVSAFAVAAEVKLKSVI